MSTSIKISANTSEVKKSLLDLSRDVKAIGKSKVSIFSESDRKFVKEELNRELGLMKTKLADNRAEIAKMVAEQHKLEKGSKEELEIRKKIIESYRTQAKLANQANVVQKQSKAMGGFGGMGGEGGGGISGIAGILGKVGTLAAGAVLGAGALALLKGIQAANQFTAGASNRVRARGLGNESMNVGGHEELANAGLTEQSFISRQNMLTARLGRAGGSRESVMQQAKFERSFGLEEGQMANTSLALRASMGGKGADQTQMKLQASIFAAGIEDAIGPYLDATTELLADINKNGLTNTDEMINMMSQLVKSGERTPEQLAESFKNLDSAVKGASGEQSAFLQTAFARGGIGGGTIGATKLAMSSGGVFGLSEEELQKRGYNADLIKNMKGAGFTKGLGGRSSAILNQFKSSAGLGAGKNIGDVTDINTMTGLSQMSNSVFGTQGMEGFDTLQMLEKVQNKQMTQKDFEAKVKEMREGKDPQVERLNKINASLEGQTDILTNIDTNLSEALGKTAVKARNAVKIGENTLTEGAGKTAADIDQSTGIGDSAMRGMKTVRDYTVGGKWGSDLYDWLHPTQTGKGEDYMKQYSQGIPDFSKKGNMPSTGGAPADSNSHEALAKAVETGVAKGMQASKAPVVQTNNSVNVRVQQPDGRVSNKTHK